MEHRWSTAGAALLATLLLLGNSGGAGATPLQTAPGADTTTLILGSSTEPDTLNTLMTNGNGATVIGAIADGLLLVDPHGRLQPDLATSVDRSPDGRTWTFHLRHGVRWSDGKPFTSADVAYTYHALLDKRHNVPSTQGWDLIDRYSTPAADTFTCHVKTVYAPFLLYVGATPLLARHIYDRPGVDFNTTVFNRRPVGTGPYMVMEWQAGDHLTLVPNPYSWHGRPAYQKIIYKIVVNPNTMLVQLQTGALDMGEVNQSLVPQARAIAGTHLVSYLSNTLYHINLKQWGFLREKVVRQALDYATPKQAIFTGILHGLGAIADSDTAPLLTSYYNPHVPQHPFNLARAAALLIHDGFTRDSDGVLRKGGQPLAIALWAEEDDANGQRIDEVLQQVWSRLGITVTLHVAGAGLFDGPSGPAFSKATTGILTADSSGPDPDDSFFWNSKWIPASPGAPGANINAYYHRYAFQRQIDALTDAGVATVDPAKRRAIYVKVQALLADEVPSIFLYWAPGEMLIPNTLKGFVPNVFTSPLWNVAIWRRA